MHRIHVAACAQLYLCAICLSEVSPERAHVPFFCDGIWKFSYFEESFNHSLFKWCEPDFSHHPLTPLAVTPEDRDDETYDQ